MDLQVTNVGMSEIRISPKNYRKTIDEKSIYELAENIRQFGLINPITVRKVGEEAYLDEESGEVVSTDGYYEIVCGERRFRACSILYEEENRQNEILSAKKKKKLDKFQTIPCVVRELSDSDAFDAMMTENLLREDVDPFEESYAFAEMMKMGKSIDDLALKFGKSASFIRKRLLLENVVDDVKQMVQRDELSMSVAMYMARYTKKQQERMLKDNYVKAGVTEKWLRQTAEWRFQKDLTKAVFGMDEDIEGFKRCSLCPNNSSCQGKLFDEAVEKVLCLDSDCFKRKTVETVALRVSELPDDVFVVYCGELDEDLKVALSGCGRPIVEFWKEFRRWPDGEMPDKDNYEYKDKDGGEDAKEYFHEEEYNEAVKEYEERVADALERNPDEYVRVVEVSNYRGVCFNPCVARRDMEEVKKKSVSEGTTTAAAVKDYRIRELEAKDKKNLEKMNENIIKDLRERINTTNLTDKRTPLDKVESRVFYALLLQECGYTFRQEKGIQADEVHDKNIMEMEFSEGDLWNIMRGFILEKITDSGVTYNRTKQVCLRAIMENTDKLGFDVAVEKYELVYNRRKSKIDEQIKEIQDEVQN